MVDETELKPDVLLCKRKGVICRSVEGLAVLVGPESPHPLRLNKTGARIWELLDRHRHVEDLIDAVQQFYEVDRDELLPDIVAFLSELLERKLIETS